MKSYHGKLYITSEIRDKAACGTMDPEERKLWYCPIAISHQQRRVMDHIFGDRQFQLKELNQIATWMKDRRSGFLTAT